MVKKSTPVYLDEYERSILEALAKKWGLSYSGVIRRLIRESTDTAG